MDESDRSKVLKAYRRYESRGSRRIGARADALIAAEREKRVMQLASQGPDAHLLLELGCAGGQVLRLFEKALRPSQSIGIDIRIKRMQDAQVGENCIAIAADATHLPFATAVFDVVVAFTLWSSLPSEAAKRRAADEATRVLRPGGKLFWYDMRYPNPFNHRVHCVRRSELTKLFPEFRISVEPITLIPTVARLLGPFTEKLYGPLARISLLRSHYIGVLERA